MNNLQKTTLEYLMDGGSQREDALDSLADRGLLNAGVTEEGTRDLILEFIEDERTRDRFCSDGINRFAEAVLGEVPKSGPREDEIVVTFRLDLTHASGDSPDSDDYDPAIADIVQRLGRMLRLAKGESPNGEPWSVDGWQLDEWNWGVHT